MLVGILSDSHDRLSALDKVLEIFQEAGVDQILHGGDYIAPFALKGIRTTGLPMVGVYGNNDGEKKGLKSLCPGIHEPPHFVELKGVKILMVHSLDQLPEDLAGAEVVIHGHTHKEEVRTDENGILFINPGECCGWLTGRCTAALLRLPEKEVEQVCFMEDS
jgi:putative phosphoesterase